MEEVTVRFDEAEFYCAECGRKKDPADGLMYQTLQRGQYEFLCCACILRIIEETEEALE